MGNQCKPIKNKNAIPHSVKNQDFYKLWEDIKNSNFDSHEFKFILQLQEVYTDTYGAFLNKE